jgi:tRNA G10  N-methylase Trm11
MHYVLELGRNIELSIAEIISVYGEDSIVSIHSEYLILDQDEDVNIDRLGGVVAVHKVHADFGGFLEDNEFVSLVVNNVEAKNIGLSSNFLSSKVLDGILRKAKEKIKSKGHSVRFLLNTKTATVLGSGFKRGKVNVFGFYRFGGKVHFTTLIGVQDIDAYSKRDFKKPYRDAKLGMLPPKLAQTMINLAGEGTVYDPFCGTGTVLMEGVLAQRDVLGSDLLKDNIIGADRNIAWLKDNFDAPGDAEVFQLDARNITDQKFDVIVTEGYLGVPKKGYETIPDMKAEMREIQTMYLDFLENLTVNHRDKFTVVMSVPVFVTSGAPLYAENMVEKVESLGYSVSALIPKGNKLELESVQTFLYKRKEQKVFRQIFRLMYNPG